MFKNFIQIQCHGSSPLVNLINQDWRDSTKGKEEDYDVILPPLKLMTKLPPVSAGVGCLLPDSIHLLPLIKQMAKSLSQLVLLTSHKLSFILLVLCGSVNECFHFSLDEGLVYLKACLLLASIVIDERKISYFLVGC